MGGIHDTEDRPYWYEHGERQEQEFLKLAAQHHLPVRLNPAKASDKTAIDLLLTLPGGQEVPADLKTQNTPFFTAARYGKNPGRAVTLNDKDIRRYERLYPDAVILFHVHWTTLTWRDQSVEPLRGVWSATLPEIKRLIQQPAHTYQRRKTDPRPNAPSSHVLSLDDLTCLLNLTPQRTSGGLPDPATAEKLLLEAERMNPGPWVAHSRNVALAARLIAEHHPHLDPVRAHTLGLLHDIGRRSGPNKDRHILDGYDYLQQLGYPEAARVALTHSFVIPDLSTLQGEWDGTPAEWERLRQALDSAQQTEEDRLLQLCDALALPDGFCTVQERLVDVALRYSVNAHTPAKWRAALNLKQQVDEACGVNIYRLLPGLTERLLR
ncbi:HD domain-containing protein [Deinococcus fonticola]|uniref:HD domain-containing protein n=1 Tax=Deinococcus fonticola TaxID=2528713 RepID=UPI001F0D1367|nr:HD domain-containing protein [Deinococcus fonticola]